MNWYIGQPIVAIGNKSGHFKKGDEFTIKGIRENECGCQGVNFDVGKKAPFKGNTICTRCGNICESGTNSYWYHETCFAPLDTDISELTEILTQKQVI